MRSIKYNDLSVGNIVMLNVIPFLSPNDKCIVMGIVVEISPKYVKLANSFMETRPLDILTYTKSIINNDPRLISESLATAPNNYKRDITIGDLALLQTDDVSRYFGFVHEFSLDDLTLKNYHPEFTSPTFSKNSHTIKISEPHNYQLLIRSEDTK